MFFTASKLTWLLSTPSSVLPVLALSGLLAGRLGLRATGQGLTWIALAGLLAAGFSPLSRWVILPLEQRFPIPRGAEGRVDGIIVLSGGINPGRSLGRGDLALTAAGSRVTAFVALARRYPEARLVYTGGSAMLEDPEGVAEADVAAAYLPGLGIPRERLLLETAARTTAENAANVRALLGPRPSERWLLVTSAWHMPRAVGCFRRAGLEVVPYPVDHRSGGRRDRFAPFAAAGEGLGLLDLAVREWLGLAAYRLSDRTDAWFPGPGTQP